MFRHRTKDRSAGVLRTYRPDIIIVMNPVYLQEIRQMIDGFGITPEIIPV